MADTNWGNPHEFRNPVSKEWLRLIGWSEYIENLKEKYPEHLWKEAPKEKEES